MALVVLGLAPLLWFLFQFAQQAATPLLGVLTIGAGTLGGLIFLVTQIYMQVTEFAVTDQRIIKKTGWISRRTNEIPLKSLENVNLDQSVFSRIFGFGRLEINGSGGSGIMSPPMQDPVSFRAAVAEARIAVEDTPHFRARAKAIDQQHNRH